MAARSIRKGSISFGLVNIPIKFYRAANDKTFSFNQYAEGVTGYNTSDGVLSKTSKSPIKRFRKDTKSLSIALH
jgi:non-homologous end joining protein Ku